MPLSWRCPDCGRQRFEFTILGYEEITIVACAACDAVGFWPSVREDTLLMAEVSEVLATGGDV